MKRKKDKQDASDKPPKKKFGEKLETSPDIKNGDQVLVQGKLNVWDRQGSYNITASNIEIAGTGDLHAEFLKIKDKYEKEGYFDTKIKNM